MGDAGESSASRVARSAGSVRALHQLARLYGVQTAYYDVERKRRSASPDALLAVLRGLGAPSRRLRWPGTAGRPRSRFGSDGPPARSAAA